MLKTFTQFNELKPFEQVELVGIDAARTPLEQDYRERLMMFGLVPGSILTFIRSAPLGDPIEIVVRGVSLLLRQQEAAVLKLKRLSM